MGLLLVENEREYCHKVICEFGRSFDHSVATVEVEGDKLTINGEISDEERKRLIDAWLLRQTNKRNKTE
jgi:hypothetical protein